MLKTGVLRWQQVALEVGSLSSELTFKVDCYIKFHCTSYKLYFADQGPPNTRLQSGDFLDPDQLLNLINIVSFLLMHTFFYIYSDTF